MTTFAFDPAVVRRQADLLEQAVDAVRGRHLEVPDTGSVCTSTEDGLALVEHRVASLAEETMRLAITIRRLAVFYPDVDDGVAQGFGGGA